MLKKKKTTASGKLVLVKSVRRTRSHRMKFCVQRGLGALPSTSKRRGKSRRDFLLCGPVCINTGIACLLYQEFTIQLVIRNSELSGVLNRKPKISRKIVLFFLITFKDFPIPSKNS